MKAKILIERDEFTSYTTGRLYINGKFFCYTLEDMYRGDAGEILAKKVYGQTAIPQGKYAAKLTDWSLRSYKVLRLENVPGFSGILIHSGATVQDTLGCILIGKNRGAAGTLNGFVETEFYQLMQSFNEYEVEIRNDIKKRAGIAGLFVILAFVWIYRNKIKSLFSKVQLV